MNNKQIENKALDVLIDVYGSMDNIVPPINLNKILQKYNLQLKSGKFSDDDISGVYDRSECAIYVAEDEPTPRKVFTIAHELGHFFMDNEVVEDTFLRSQGLNPDREDRQREIEANIFAASLLMPEFLVRRIWMQFKNTETIAQIFGVSNTACYYRLKNLGLLDQSS